MKSENLLFRFGFKGSEETNTVAYDDTVEMRSFKMLIQSEDLKFHGNGISILYGEQLNEMSIKHGKTFTQFQRSKTNKLRIELEHCIAHYKQTSSAHV